LTPFYGQTGGWGRSFSKIEEVLTSFVNYADFNIICSEQHYVAKKAYYRPIQDSKGPFERLKGPTSREEITTT